MHSTHLRSALAAAILSLGSSTVLAQANAVGAAASAPTSAPTAAPAAAATDSAAERGKIAWYGRKFTGRKTASGEAFNPNALTMAHKTLPFGTLVQVTNPLNGKSVQVRVNDRGPFIAGRVADLSHAAARQIDMLRAGVAHVRLEIVSAFN